MKRSVETPLPFRKLHKKWGDGLWLRITILGLAVVLVISLLCLLLTGIIDWIYPQPRDGGPAATARDVLLDLISGVLGGSIVYAAARFRRSVHNAAHYGQELRDHINDAQNRYILTQQEAAELLAFDDDALLTIDNFFRYVDHEDQNDYLPRIQQFGTLTLPHGKGYLRITLYWQRDKGFFLTEWFNRNLGA